MSFRLAPFVPKEADVKGAILDLLAAHPKVHRAWVVNSGAMIVGEGRERRFVRFNGVPGHSDIAGVLKGGRALYIETKRPGWKRPTDQRERDQESFLADVSKAGALAFFATGLEDVLVMLETAR